MSQKGVETWQKTHTAKVEKVDFWVTLRKKSLKNNLTKIRLWHFYTIYKRGNEN